MLSVQTRAVFGKKLRPSRRQGLVPAVLYGGSSAQARPLFVRRDDFERVFARAGESTLLTLALGEGEERQVLIHDFARDPVSAALLHVDFYEVRMDEKLHTKVPLVIVGESAAVKNEGGVLIRALREVEISCLPANLPHGIQVDITPLRSFRDTLRLRDIAMPPGVEVHGDPDEVIVVIEPPRSERELAELEETVQPEAIAEIKTIKEERQKSEEVSSSSEEQSQS